MEFQRDYQFEYGVARNVAPGIRRVVARNPSAFTFHGTGTYIVGHGKVAVIDPGPMIDEHVQALWRALEGEQITHILVTHTHLDHSPACAALQTLVAAPTYAFGPHGSGNSGDPQVEEGADRNFTPDIRVSDGEIIAGDDWSFECVYTPGHTSNHMCYQWREGRALFCGDHVMGWSSTIVAPPDGDMSDYLTSLERLLTRDEDMYWPTHGPGFEQPREHVRALIRHRHEREQQIIDCLSRGVQRIPAMVESMYDHLPRAMYPAAAQQVLSALMHLRDTERVRCGGAARIDSEYTVVE